MFAASTRLSCLAPLSSATQQQPLPSPPLRLRNKHRVRTNHLVIRWFFPQNARACQGRSRNASKSDQLQSRHRHDWNILPAGIAGHFCFAYDGQYYPQYPLFPTLPYLHIFILFIRISRTHCFIFTRSIHPRPTLLLHDSFYISIYPPYSHTLLLELVRRTMRPQRRSSIHRPSHHRIVSWPSHAS